MPSETRDVLLNVSETVTQKEKENIIQTYFKYTFSRGRLFWRRNNWFVCLVVNDKCTERDSIPQPSNLGRQSSAKPPTLQQIHLHLPATHAD